MMKLWLALLAAFLAFLPARAAPPAGVAIVGVDILPMTKRDRLRDQTVLIDGDRITRTGPRASVPVPAGYRVVDGAGLTLLPGLVDMHVHLANEPGRPGDAAQRALAVMLGHGVTTARGMAGGSAHPALRDAIARGEVVGPRLYVASPPLNVRTVASVEAARAAVRAAKAQGFDLVKTHHLEDPAIWAAGQEEARVVALPTAGHVTSALGLDRAAASGQQVEHLDGAIHALLPESAPERAIAFGQIPPPSVLRAAAAVDDARLEELARQMAARRSYQVPTLSLFEKIANVDRPLAEAAADPAMRYVPDAALQAWSQQHGQLKAAGFTGVEGRELTNLRRRIVRAYANAGVPIMAGSDTAQAFHIWGPGLIEELEAMVRAGLTPLQALRSATSVPRDYFRSLLNQGSARSYPADFGTVEPGARADLILVRGDPSRDIGALRALQTVIAAGRVFDRAALDAMLDRAAADAKAGPTAPTAKPVLVMRHLHTAEGPDPTLSPEGARAAAALAEQLARAGIAAIHVTATRRSRETAASLAARLGIAPETYDPRDPGGLIARLAARPGAALVVAHSNTVPDLIARLGGTPPPPLAHDAFGDLWLVEPGGRTSRLKVGGPALDRIAAGQQAPEKNHAAH